MKNRTQDMTESYTLRQASRNDDENIAKLSVTAWQESYSEIFPKAALTSLQWQTRATGRKDFFKDPKRDSIAIEINKNIIAYADYGPARLQDNTDIDNSYAEIYAIYVLDNFKRKGFGKLLYKSIEKALTENEYKKLIIWTLTKNYAAIYFYGNRPVKHIFR